MIFGVSQKQYFKYHNSKGWILSSLMIILSSCAQNYVQFHTKTSICTYVCMHAYYACSKLICIFVQQVVNHLVLE